ncbi:MAG: anthranilate phosphoribosyltransferase [Candidatus Omnitrophica bacterium]|nr:anthranilate phosphoribosyltransferase [Candidatus Omnitrophota bacterium]
MTTGAELKQTLSSAGRITPRDMQGFIRSLLTGVLNDQDILEGLKASNDYFGASLTPSEDFLVAASQIMLEFAVPFQAMHTSCDTCGTGGDGKHLFNISSLAALTVASCGFPVVKHGNRAVSGSFGSADFFEKIGIPIDLTPQDAQKTLEHSGFTFLFAPIYHPAMKYAAKARKMIGTRTIFNCLGPLANPARPNCQTIGVFSESLMLPMLKASKQLGVGKVSIVHSEDGADEVTTWCRTKILTSRDSDSGSPQEIILEVQELGIRAAEMSDFQCANPDDALSFADQILSGKTGKASDLVALNAAVTIWTQSESVTLKKAFDMAHAAIAEKKIRDLVAKIRKRTD